MERAQDFGHIRALDGIRGFAVIVVFLYHALSYELVPTSFSGTLLKKVATTGWIGVDLFFVLSGFLITTILLDARASTNYFKVFYIRRALRIFPLYYLVMLVALLVLPGSYPFQSQIWYWLNLSNFPTAFVPFTIPFLAHFWSLAIEEQFYFVWPSIVRWVRARTLGYICVGVIAGLFVVRNLPPILALHRQWPELLYRLTPFRVDTLCAGALLAVIVQARPDFSRYRTLLRIACVISGIIFLYVSFGHLYDVEMVVRFGYTSLVVFCFSLTALALFPEGITSRIFSNGFLRKTGKYSYCLYLLHPFLINYLAGQGGSIRTVLDRLHLGSLSSNTVFVLLAIVEFGFVFALSSLSWQIYEGPILRLKRHARYTPVPKHYLA